MSNTEIFYTAPIIDGEPGNDIIILAGQSNKQGQGIVGAEDTGHPRVFEFTQSNETILAEHPLNHFNASYSSHETRSLKMGMDIDFAKLYVDTIPKNRNVVLVPCALGGSGFYGGNGLWNIDNFLDPNNHSGYLAQSMIERGQAALESAGGRDNVQRGLINNRIVAVLWHQGEHDHTVATQDEYSYALDRLIQYTRVQFGFEVPWIVGDLTDGGYPATGDDPRSSLADLPNRLRFTGFAPSTGFVGKNPPTDYHFSAAEQRIFATRYWTAYQEAVTNTDASKEIAATRDWVFGTDNPDLTEPINGSRLYILRCQPVIAENYIEIPALPSVASLTDIPLTTDPHTIVITFKVELDSNPAQEWVVVGSHRRSSGGTSFRYSQNTGEVQVLHKNNTGATLIESLGTALNDRWIMLSFGKDFAGNERCFRLGFPVVDRTGQPTNAPDTAALDSWFALGDLYDFNTANKHTPKIASVTSFPTMLSELELQQLGTRLTSRLASRGISLDQYSDYQKLMADPDLEVHYVGSGVTNVLTDQSANSRDGTWDITDGEYSSDVPADFFGQSIDITNGTITIPTTVFDGLTDVTLSFWWKNPEWVSSESPLFGLGVTGSTPFMRYQTTSGGRIQVAGPKGSCHTDTTVPTAGEWNHYLIEFTGNTPTAFIINGVDELNGATAGGGMSANPTALIGGGGSASAVRANGLITDLNVFSRLLTASEKDSLYTFGL